MKVTLDNAQSESPNIQIRDNDGELIGEIRLDEGHFNFGGDYKSPSDYENKDGIVLFSEIMPDLNLPPS